MKRKTCLYLLLVLLICGCSLIGESLIGHFPRHILPANVMPRFLIGYCWQMPNGRVSINNPDNREVSVVIGEVWGKQDVIIRNGNNLPPSYLSDFYIYKSGCVEYGDKIRYIGNAVSLNPKNKTISFVSGSDYNLTDFEFFDFNPENSTYTKVSLLSFEEYSKHFVEPKHIFWSSDGEKIATLGMDVGSGGTNIWIYDINTKSFFKATDFTEVGEWAVNASWSGNGDKLAVGLGEVSGIRIIDFSNDNLNPSYIEVSHNTNAAIGEWPYIYKNLVQLTLYNKKIRFNKYIYSVSSPVWIDESKIVFAAANSRGLSSLYVVNSSGGEPEELVDGMDGIVFMPTLSPNGKTLAFVRYLSWAENYEAEIGVIDLSSEVITSLSVVESTDKKTPLFISGMTWSPDSNYLAFSSNFMGESDVYIVSSDGQYYINTTKNIDGNAVSPFWFSN